jgi:hypothetical protein
MKASVERKIIRWMHILISIPIVGYVYGPVANIPEAVVTIRYVLFPVVILSGFWMWVGHKVKKWF